MHTAEGRALPREDGSFAYEYSYKDHLGNLRVSFRAFDTANTTPTAALREKQTVLDQ